MRQPQIYRLVLIFLLLPASVRAQKTDWQTVKDLAPGTPISVKYGHFFLHNRCIFESATDDVLICERTLYGPSQIFIPPEAVYRRKLVREVRLEHSDASNIAVGAVIGGGIGAALGASGPGDASARTRLDLGLLVGMGGALLGGLIGRDFPIRHGTVIYHR
jgi:hypothetical protein